MHIILDKTAASKLYKTLQQQITLGYAKHRFSVISGTKTVKIIPKNNP